MQLTPSALQSIYFNLRVAFMEGFTRPPKWWDQVATEMPSTTAENRYAWMSRIPKLREWIGERMLRNVAANVYTLRNKDFEASIEIDRNDIEDDNLGVFGPIAGQLGEQAALWPQDLIATVLAAAETSTVLAWDGQPFFNASHPVSFVGLTSGTYSNLLTTTPLTSDNYSAARAAMMSYLGEDGKPLGVVPNVLMVPPQLEVKAKQIVESQVIASVFGSNTAAAAIDNVNKGTARVLTVPELAAYADQWYLLDTTKGIKPIIFQNRRAAQLTALTNPSDPNVFFHKKFIYGVDVRGNAGVSLPFLMLKAKGS
jgi:phage major head subunit gpT-like protein